MAVRVPAPSVLVIVCVLAATVSPALLAGVASPAPGTTTVDPATSRGDGSVRAGTPPANATDRAPSPPGTATATAPPTARPTAPPGIANATGGVAGDGGDGSDGFLGGIAQWFAGLLNALSNPLKTFQGYARKMLQLLVNRPVPTRNGDPAWFSRPDEPVMGAVYDVTWTQTLPVAILLATLYAGLATGMRGLVPPSVVPNRQATGAVWKAIGTAFHVLLGWTIMVAWAVVVHGVAVWFAPSGVTVLPSGQTILDQVVAGGLGGYILWGSSGLLALLVMIVWVLSWIGTLLAPPAYPLLVAAKPPDVPVFRKFRMLPEEGILFALVAVPVPTAFVLGIGYPIINALRTATTGPIATLGGIAITPLLTLGLWLVALIAPLIMLMNGRDMRPITMFAAGALGAASAITVRDKLGRLPDSVPRPDGLGGGTGYGAGVGGGTTMDPLEGSPFQHSTDEGFGGAIGGDGGGRTSVLGAGAGGERGAAGATGGGAGSAVAPFTSGSGTAGPGTSGEASIGETSRRVGNVEEIPDGQQYELGVELSDGEWQPVKDNTYSYEWLFGDDDAFSRVEDAVDADTLYARGVQDAETYDIQDDLNDH